MIRLHDTMARAKREFEPADPARVTMYVCGPTVYNRAHIGNARPYVVFDVLARLIRHNYGPDSLAYARNFTDVDDKIIDAARAEGVDPSVVTARYEKLFLDDMGALGVLPTTYMPRATEHIGEMIAMIARLIETGHAYEADGHVLFHVPSDPDYGALGRRDREAMVAGARVEVASYKKDPADFVLWKPSPEGVIGWDSPWGRGRPGWHIECSAMIERHLGETTPPAASVKDTAVSAFLQTGPSTATATIDITTDGTGPISVTVSWFTGNIPGPLGTPDGASQTFQRSGATQYTLTVDHTFQGAGCYWAVQATTTPAAADGGASQQLLTRQCEIR